MAQWGFGMFGAAPKWDQPARLKTKRKAPPGMGPGFFLGDPILKVIDPNHDDQVTLGEWIAAVKKHFQMWDKENKGSLDQKALSTGLDALFPPPPGEEPAPPAAKPQAK